MHLLIGVHLIYQVRSIVTSHERHNLIVLGCHERLVLAGEVGKLAGAQQGLVYARSQLSCGADPASPCRCWEVMPKRFLKFVSHPDEQLKPSVTSSSGLAASSLALSVRTSPEMGELRVS